MTVREDDIVHGLCGLGIESGDTLMVHSSLSSFGWVQGGAVTVVTALLEVLGKQGTLIVPTFSRYLRGGENTWDREQTPSLMGEISETLRLWPGALRSSHPAHPLAAWGKHADLICRKPHKTGFGRDSPFKTLLELEASILLMGVSYNTCTFFHLLEVEADVPYRYLEERKATVIIDGEKREGSAWEYTPKKGTKNDFEILGKLLEERGCVRKSKIGESTERLFGVQAAYRIGMEKLNKDPLFLLSRECRDRWRSKAGSACQQDMKKGRK